MDEKSSADNRPRDSAARDADLIDAARRQNVGAAPADASDAGTTRERPGGAASDPAGPTAAAFAGYKVVRELSHGGLAWIEYVVRVG